MATAQANAQGEISLAELCGTSELGIDLKDIIQLQLVKSLAGGGEEGFKLDTLIDVVLAEKLSNKLLAKITIPESERELGEVVCLMMDMDRLKAFMAALKGEEVQVDIFKPIELAYMIKFLSRLG